MWTVILIIARDMYSSSAGAQQVSQNSLTESTAQLGSHAARIGILPIIATIITTAGLVLCMTGSPLLGFRRQKECIIIHIIILVCLLVIFRILYFILAH